MKMKSFKSIDMLDFVAGSQKKESNKWDEFD